MTLVALTHGYVPGHSLGGEVSLHRTLVAADRDVVVLTRTDREYELDGITVKPIGDFDVLNVNADAEPIIRLLRDLDASAVLAQNELSWPAVKAARALGLPSIVSLHTPPQYGRSIARAVQEATHRVYNTHASAVEWRKPGLVLHPPVPALNGNTPNRGDAYTILSNLSNKGVAVVLDLAEQMPDQRFIIVRSPAEITHGLDTFEERSSALPNVEVYPRVEPDRVAELYLSQTRILLVPSRFETYGLSAIEAASYGIPSVHVDTPHVREGIGDAAELIRPLSRVDASAALVAIEADYPRRSRLARARADYILARQEVELTRWRDWLNSEVPNARRDPGSGRAA